MKFIILALILLSAAVWLVPAFLENPAFIIAVLGAGILMIISITNFETGLLLLLLVIPLASQANLGAAGGAPVDFGTDDFFIFCLFLVWLVYLGKTKQAPFVENPLTWPFLSYLAACLISFIPMIAIRTTQPVLSLLHLVKWYEYVFIYFVLVKCLETRDQIERFAALAVGSSVLIAVMDAGEIVMGTPAKWATASFESNGILGAFYLFFMNIAISFLVEMKGARLRAVLAASIALLTFGLFNTGARAAYLGAVVSVIVLGLLHRKQWLFLAILAMLAVPALWNKVVTEEISKTFTMDAAKFRQDRYQDVGSYRLNMLSGRYRPGTTLQLDVSSAERFIQWKKARNQIYRNPIIGTGYWSGRFIGVFRFTTAHSFYLTLLIETGAIGFLAFMWLAWSLLYHSWVFSRRTLDPFYSALAKGFASGFTGILVHCFFGETFEAFRLTGPLWMTAGILFAAKRLDESGRGTGLPEEPAFEA